MAEGGPSLWKHLAVGLAVGTAIGLAVGLTADLTRDGDAHIPVTFFTVPEGAIVGTLVGGIVWAVRKAN